ncbi:MAG: hypothetical protein HY719_17710 [Planctomycetes bacterium]|nr:hypothetical protein [Planctomycetota bacterium]
MREIIERFERRRRELVAEAEGLFANVPLRYLAQQAHFTTPASNYDMVQKAVEKGWSATPKILDKAGITLRELAETLGVEVAALETLLAKKDPRSPLVMVDGEDAQALRDDVVARGRENSVRIFREADWGRTLRFYRPSGMNLKYCVEDVFLTLTGVAEGRDPNHYPIDGIVFPKSEHPAELRWVCEMLAAIEERLGLPRNRIRVQFLVESGWCAAQLPDMIRACHERLAGIIWGIADYSADTLLPEIRNDHPQCDWARHVMVNLAATVGVPCIDNMTVNYPVADPALSPGENQARLLRRLKECYDDALYGCRLGMSGKWVGHPLQLFVVLLAYRNALPEEEVRAEVAKIDAYGRAVAAEQGATIIAGVMSDRATDRHARNRLRRAIAVGHLDTATGLRLGLINREEAAELGG